MSIRKIGIIGLEEHDKVMLKAAIDTASGFATGLWQCAELDQDPEMIILNPDTPEGESALHEYAEQKNAPMLVYCSEKLEVKKRRGRLSIKRPLSYSNVLPVLRQADSMVASSLLNTAPAKQQKEKHPEPVITEERSVSPKEIKTDVTEATEAITFSTQDKKLYQLIDHFIKENKSVELSHPSFPSIRICSVRKWFIFGENLSNHTLLFRTNADEFTITEMGEALRKQAFVEHFPKPLWELVFTATLLGSKSILSSSIEKSDLLYLTQIPEFDKVPHTQEHISIASYMTYLSATVDTMEEDLAIDRSTIIDFCNACHAIGLLLVRGELPSKPIKLISNAIAAKKSVEISHPDFPSIQINSSKDSFIFPEKLEKNRELFGRSISEFTVVDKDKEISKDFISDISPKSIPVLIYSATLFATEGKLIQPLKAEQRLSLGRLPNFEVVPYTSEHKSLAIYMSNYADTICNISINTRIAIPVVIDFCNACEAIGLVEKNSRRKFPLSSIESDTTVESSIKHEDLSESQGLLQSLLLNMKDKKMI